MKLYCIIALSLLLRPETATAQQEESITLSLQQAIEIAQENSPEAQAARHTYRAAYWNYRFFRANYLPSVTLTSSPTLNREPSILYNTPSDYSSPLQCNQKR